MNNLNLLINASNQANLSGRNNSDSLQMNVVMVLIWPYEIERLELEGLDLDIYVDEKGNFNINDKLFKTVRIAPGVRVLGISKRVPE